MLHNSAPAKKKVHMQNISHIPICIDWVVYDIPEEVPEKPKLIELIPVVDNNPFNHVASETTIMENNDEVMSQTTISTSRRREQSLYKDSVVSSGRSGETVIFEATNTIRRGLHADLSTA
jgi:hypothetical protein